MRTMIVLGIGIALATICLLLFDQHFRRPTEPPPVVPAVPICVTTKLTTTLWYVHANDPKGLQGCVDELKLDPKTVVHFERTNQQSVFIEVKP